MLATLLVQYNPDGSLVYQNPYLNTQLVMGRQPFQYVEIDLDYCANTAGVAPCAASQTGDAKCFNTYATCNDTPNFNLTTKTYRFCSPNGAKVPQGLDAIIDNDFRLLEGGGFRLLEDGSRRMLEAA